MPVLLGMASAASAQSWTVVRQPGKQDVALSSGTGPIGRVALSCEGATPVMGVSFAGAMPRTSYRAMAAIGSRQFAMVFQHLGAPQMLFAKVEPAMLTAIAGADPASRMAIVLEGARASTIPTQAAGQAFGQALRTCYDGGASVGEGAFSSTIAAGPNAPTGSLPLRDSRTGKPQLPVRLGTYAKLPSRCGSGDFTFIDVGLGAYSSETQSGMRSIRKTGTNTYAAVEDEGYEESSLVSTVYTITDQTSFTVKAPPDYNSKTPRVDRYVFCPLDSLPRAQQRWIAADHKPVTHLPIEPGYYRMNGEFGDKTLDAPCRQECGFALFQADGMIEKGVIGSTTSTHRSTSRFNQRVQTGASTYQVAGTARFNAEAPQAWEWTFDVASPTRFSYPDGESVNEYVKVDVKTIPAALMPR